MSDGQAKKQALVDTYRQNSLRMGLDVPHSDLDKIAIADLQTIDKHKAEVKTKVKPDRAGPNHQTRETHEAERENKVFEMAKKRGVEAFIREANTTSLTGDPILDATAGTHSPKFNAMIARFFQIVTIKGALKTGGFTEAADATETPKLAKEAIMHHLMYSVDAVGGKKNPYRGLGLKDRARKYKRFVEDICDRSVPFYGPWWIR